MPIRYGNARNVRAEIHQNDACDILILQMIAIYPFAIVGCAQIFLTNAHELTSLLRLNAVTYFRIWFSDRRALMID